ncbi:hypothetical protein GPJ56_005391 [Histomonas meleagridis]|uniref:uncharacterized protein n=1 Tax=Histomonas meleagridis TaxID=135588 RepID=UPI0035596589|nr:hypothetical protein GPJ56_005391 [Histomonas meleagridis]KAH0803575.1 hypothetical protein GO595_003626 [Histomonas meleagridis]
MDALLRCSSAEDQKPSETLRAAIDSISNTIAALRSGTKTLSDVKRFHLHVDLPVSNDPEILITMEITKKPKSHPLPLGCFIEVKPPVGDVAKTPPATKLTDNYTYTHVFNLGERTSQQIDRLKRSDFEFRIYHRNVTLGRVRNVIHSIATTPIAPLTYSLSVTSPLLFIAMDGKKTNFQFNVQLFVDSPLVSADELIIDENIDVINE